MVRAASNAALTERERARGLSEIAARRHLDACGAAAEIGRIEIELEDLALAQKLLDARGEDHLPHLAFVGDILAHQEILHDLLRDGRAALRPAGLREVADEGADQRALVDALVLVEALVLGRDEGPLHLLGNFGERNEHAALVLLEQLREPLALAVEHDAGARKLQALELAGIGKVGNGLVVEVDHLADVDRRIRHRLVLAELPVGDEKIVDVDPAEDRDAAGHGLGVIHGGGDQVVDIEVLDVEGFAHVHAARAQEAHDLGWSAVRSNWVLTESGVVVT